MKILHQGPALQEPEAPRSGADPEQEPHRPTPLSNDARSLHTMLEAIRKFRAGDLPLQVLVGELEFHLQALIMSEHDWQHSFFERWRELDRYHSQQMSRGSDEMPPEAVKRIDGSLEGLRQLIHDMLSQAGDG